MIPVPISSILRHKGNGVWSIAPDASVYQAIAIMAEKGIGALPVIADGQLLGILSERDYARKVVLQSRSSKDTLVSEIMTTPVVTVGPSNTVEDCMRTMTLQRIRHLPVVDDGKILGIVSIGDLVRKVISTQGEIIQHLQEYISGRPSA
jgi:CBS domain-containing protein